jgi:hypothetical protein
MGGGTRIAWLWFETELPQLAVGRDSTEDLIVRIFD